MSSVASSKSSGLSSRSSSVKTPVKSSSVKSSSVKTPPLNLSSLAVPKTSNIVTIPILEINLFNLINSQTSSIIFFSYLQQLFRVMNFNVTKSIKMIPTELTSVYTKYENNFNKYYLDKLKIMRVLVLRFYQVLSKEDILGIDKQPLKKQNRYELEEKKKLDKGITMHIEILKIMTGEDKPFDYIFQLIAIYVISLTNKGNVNSGEIKRLLKLFNHKIKIYDVKNNTKRIDLYLGKILYDNNSFNLTNFNKTCKEILKQNNVFENANKSLNQANIKDDVLLSNYFQNKSEELIKTSKEVTKQLKDMKTLSSKSNPMKIDIKTQKMDKRFKLDLLCLRYLAIYPALVSLIDLHTETKFKMVTLLNNNNNNSDSEGSNSENGNNNNNNNNNSSNSNSRSRSRSSNSNSSSSSSNNNEDNVGTDNSGSFLTHADSHLERSSSSNHGNDTSTGNGSGNNNNNNNNNGTGTDNDNVTGNNKDNGNNDTNEPILIFRIFSDTDEQYFNELQKILSFSNLVKKPDIKYRSSDKENVKHEKIIRGLEFILSKELDTGITAKNPKKASRIQMVKEHFTDLLANKIKHRLV